MANNPKTTLLHALGFLACLITVAFAQTSPSSANGAPSCKAVPSKADPIIGYSELYGNRNVSDTVWHDQEWAFRAYGPLSKFTLLKAWYYDGEWHDPGEFKGLQTWYGHGAEQYTHRDQLLLGARKPHIPKDFVLYRDEVLLRAELQWDHIMRWANFTSSHGRFFAWGFPNVTNATTAVVEAPAPGAYIAAFRGFEGKPLPPSLGGYKKRYISQLGFVWAVRDCGPGSASSSSVVSESQALTPAKLAADSRGAAERKPAQTLTQAAQAAAAKAGQPAKAKAGQGQPAAPAAQPSTPAKGARPAAVKVSKPAAKPSPPKPSEGTKPAPARAVQLLRGQN